MFSGLQYKLRLTARRAALGAVGVSLITVGLAFLTVAAFSGLMLVTTLPIAALVLGGAYLGIGLIVMGISGGSSHASPPTARTQEAPTDLVTSAFMQGMQTGASVRQTLNR